MAIPRRWPLIMGRTGRGPGGQRSSCSADRNPGQHEGPVCCDHEVEGQLGQMRGVSCDPGC